MFSIQITRIALLLFIATALLSSSVDAMESSPEETLKIEFYDKFPATVVGESSIASKLLEHSRFLKSKSERWTAEPGKIQFNVAELDQQTFEALRQLLEQVDQIATHETLSMKVAQSAVDAFSQFENLPGLVDYFDVQSMPAVYKKLVSLLAAHLKDNYDTNILALRAMPNALRKQIGKDFYINYCASLKEDENNIHCNDLETQLGVGSLDLSIQDYLDIGFDFKKRYRSSDHLLDLSRLLLSNVSNNQITAIPSKIEGLRRLLWLNLADNPIKVIPAKIEGLGGLSIFELNNNQITAVPAKIEGLENLNWLDLQGNPLNLKPQRITGLFATIVY